jgi:hypothetical protein
MVRNSVRKTATYTVQIASSGFPCGKLVPTPCPLRPVLSWDDEYSNSTHLYTALTNRLKLNHFQRVLQQLALKHDQQAFGLLIDKIHKLREPFRSTLTWPLRCVYKIHSILFQVELQP